MALPAPGPGCGTKPEITLLPATALRAGSRLGAPCPSAPTATPRAWGVRPDSSRSSGSAAVSPVPSPVGCRSRRLAIFLTCFPCMVVCHVRVAPCVKSCTRPPPPKMNRSAWDLGLGTDRLTAPFARPRPAWPGRGPVTAWVLCPVPAPALAQPPPLASSPGTRGRCSAWGAGRERATAPPGWCSATAARRARHRPLDQHARRSWPACQCRDRPWSPCPGCCLALCWPPAPPVPSEVMQSFSACICGFVQ